jgi:dGTPase
MQELSKRIQAANHSLAPYAVAQGKNLDREFKEEEDETRFPLQRDRDRIIHTQAFRRLKHKTQVFVAGKGDHYRTRLTHTMEVAQISRDMARTLGLNEDLAECIALAHDLGHTPFGHAGEDAMRKEMNCHDLHFEHNQQSLRVVTLLEERSKKYAGLNLNTEVLEGLMKHRTAFDKEHGHDLPRSPSLEAQIVNLADEIAYTAHDTDDGLRADVLLFESLMNIPLFAEAVELSKNNKTKARGSIIHLLVMDAYAETEKRLKAQKINTLDDVYSAKEDLVAFSAAMSEKLKTLREYLWEHFYRSEAVRVHSSKGEEIIRTLFAAYEKEPPEKVLELQGKTGSTLPEAIKDYIAGMTDSYANSKVGELQEKLVLTKI